MRYPVTEDPTSIMVRHGFTNRSCSDAELEDIHNKKRKLKREAIQNLRLGKWADAYFAWMTADGGRVLFSPKDSQMESNKIIPGNCLEILKEMPGECIDTIITSPPYWGLRDYGVKKQLGLEKTPEDYTIKMVEVFREVSRVLKKEGTLWLVLGDSYCSAASASRDKH